MMDTPRSRIGAGRLWVMGWTTVRSASMMTAFLGKFRYYKWNTEKNRRLEGRDEGDITSWCGRGCDLQGVMSEVEQIILS
jgi:hypothetical protein